MHATCHLCLCSISTPFGPLMTGWASTILTEEWPWERQRHWTRWPLFKIGYCCCGPISCSQFIFSKIRVVWQKLLQNSIDILRLDRSCYRHPGSKCLRYIKNRLVEMAIIFISSNFLWNYRILFILYMHTGSKSIYIWIDMSKSIHRHGSWLSE